MSAAPRSILIEKHRSYAHAIAADILKKLPPHAERDELQAAAELGLVEAAQGRIGTPVDQILLFCFHYDPVTGSYSALAMNSVRVAGAITVVVLVVISRNQTLLKVHTPACLGRTFVPDN